MGILTYESPEFRHAIDPGLFGPLCAATGSARLQCTDLTPPQALSDQGSLVSSIQNAVLKFRSNGVTHVMFLDWNSSITYFFLKQAKSQEYYPRYGFSSLRTPPSSKRTLAPISSLEPSAWAGFPPRTWSSPSPSNPARSPLRVSRREPRARRRTAPGLQLTHRRPLHPSSTASNAPPGVTPSDFRTGVAALGTTNLTAAAGFIDSWSTTKPWGGSQVRPLKYVTSCSCFQYSGPAQTVS